MARESRHRHWSVCRQSQEDEEGTRLLAVDQEDGSVDNQLVSRPQRRCARAALACSLLGVLLVAAPVLLQWFPRVDPAVVGRASGEGLSLLHGGRGNGTTLFCFSVSMNTGYEVSLVKAQHKAKAGIFACDSWEVYSIESFPLGPHADTVAIPGPPAVWKPQPGSTSVFNTDVFLRAWGKIKEGQLHQKVDWVAKADIDTVFLPNRLKKELQQDEWKWVTQWNGAVYVQNCWKWTSMQGPLEVLSRKAVEIFLDQLGSCKSSIMMDQMGEDQFLDQCLGQLGVQGVAGYHILSDFYCAGMPKACDCAHAAHLESSAFHPCKSQKRYFECLYRTANSSELE